MKEIIMQEAIENKIFIVRNHKVMLSPHLSELYNIPAKALLQAVKRNMSRFPEDFMFKLTWIETKALRSQIVTLNKDSLIKRGQHIKYQPYAFTEQGVAMLSSVLNSQRAIQVNIAIMRTFVRVKHFLIVNKEIGNRLAELERKYEKHDSEIQSVFEAIRQLIKPLQEKTNKIGFHKE
ncbi:MAG: hypothetical protein A2252_01050 [Elusimicrobia bacterium RIFOXYA2_FULL_39_19]|nr:MAG: hypothetical protein A2252_01050 [Elusimicrobia bacterium RIFOXYA2_FULL_39_19]